MIEIILIANINFYLTHPLVLIAVFIISTVIGYFLIKNVPSLLHTPLMSGMNALSGITIVGALLTTAVFISKKSRLWGAIIGGTAIVLSIINVVGGFLITDRMLKMFTKREQRHDLK